MTPQAEGDSSQRVFLGLPARGDALKAQIEKHAAAILCFTPLCAPPRAQEIRLTASALRKKKGGVLCPAISLIMYLLYSPVSYASSLAQPKEQRTACFQPRVSFSRVVFSISGLKIRSSCQMERRSSLLVQKPTDRPAR